MVMRNCFLLWIFIVFVSCEKERIFQEGSLDPDFVPSIIPVNLNNGNVLSEFCFYENNYVNLIAAQLNGKNHKWYKFNENQSLSFVSDSVNLKVKNQGVYKLKYRQNEKDTSITLRLNYCAVSVTFPQVFNPGANQFNLWRPIGLGVAKWELSIENERKRTMYESDSFADAGWDGTNTKGKAAPQGTYTYFLKGTYRNGFFFEFKGTFRLIR